MSNRANIFPSRRMFSKFNPRKRCMLLNLQNSGNDPRCGIRIFGWMWGWVSSYEVQVCWTSSSDNSLDLSKCKALWKAMWKLCSFEQFFILLFCAVEPKIGNDNYWFYIIYICYLWKEFAILTMWYLLYPGFCIPRVCQFIWG